MQKCSKALSRLGTIYLSKSRCIYENLAFEEWVFRNHSLEKSGEAMLLWSNSPSVVIGRHQNPWLEADLKYCEENSIKLARRHSGGGTVYHDLGNLNVSLLTSQKRHNRHRNLSWLAECLNSELGISLVPTKRDSLVLQPSEAKISGTAARVSDGRAYHHLTILVNVDLETLHATLHSKLMDKIHTSATPSQRARLVGCLGQLVSGITVSEIQDIVMDCFKSNFEDCQTIEWTHSEDDKLQYPGLHENFRMLDSKEWVFGRTPKFELSIFNTVVDDFVSIVVERGRIKESTHVDFPVGVSFRRALSESKYY
ncbi:putative lipoate-protein ligase A [Ditylenchus destructor]|nr:putative lipoate-protein ligase A [Ditylenchus destructor]